MTWVQAVEKVSPGRKSEGGASQEGKPREGCITNVEL